MTLLRSAGRSLRRYLGRYLVITAAALCAAGCASSAVTVSADFPTPLIEPLPLRVGLILDDELSQYEHFEDLPRQSTWTIRLGGANVALLAPLFDTMFVETRSVTESGFAQALGSLDGVIRPTLEAFEFEVPVGADRNEQFVEVWMQYNLELYDRNGELVINWPVSGYGKAALNRSREHTVSQATTIAMRDVGAAILTRFMEQPQVTFWLEEMRNDSALSAGTQLVN